MFGRFTERAQKVVVLSQEEARRLGHNVVGTEHILLGLAAEGEGVAARALQAEVGPLLQQARALTGPLTPAACRERLQRFVAPYAAYVRDVIDRPRVGLWRAWWLWAKHRWQWRRALPA